MNHGKLLRKLDGLKMSLKKLIGVKSVGEQQIIQDPIYTPSGVIDWAAMEKARESVFIWIDHETNTISFKMQEDDECDGCSPEDLVTVSYLMRGLLE